MKALKFSIIKKKKIDSNNNFIEKKETKEFEMNYKKISAKRKLIGYFFLVLIVIIIIFSSVITKNTEKNVKPFLFTYLNYNFFIFFLLFDKIKNNCKKDVDKNESDEEYFQIRHDVDNDSRFSDAMKRFNTVIDLNYEENFVVISITLTILWYSTNSLFNYSLTKTSFTSVTGLNSSSLLFVLLFEYFFLKNKQKKKNFFTIFKIFALIFSFFGMFMISFFDNYDNQAENLEFIRSYSNSSLSMENENSYQLKDQLQEKPLSDSLIGDILSICAALVYSMYVVYLKKQSKKYKASFNITEIFGFIGLFNLLLVPFFLFFLHLTKVEIFTLPSINDFLFIILNATIAGLIGDFMMNYAILLLNPDIVTFGLTMDIPGSYIVDIFYKKNFRFNIFYLMGVIGLIFGFCLIAFENYRKKKNSREENVDKN